MKKLVVLSFCLIGFVTLSAQFSVSAKYSLNSYPEWEEIINESPVSSEAFIADGIEYGLSYWFRLKNYRVEFLPELSFQNTQGQRLNGEGLEFAKQSFYLNFNTQIYTLDIEGDCNCPTWGKDGSFIEKGFFVGINPAIAYHKLEILDNENETGSNENTMINFRLGVSTGLDIGITEWITISPYITLNYTPSLVWENLENQVNNGNKPLFENKSKIWEIQPGIRLMFRPDYLKEQRGMFR